MAKIKPFPAHHDFGTHPWKRQPGESESQHTWFRRYLSMPLPRSIRRLAEQHQVSEDHLYAVSSARHWADRAWAWDMSEQTQWDREVLLRQRRRHADLTEAATHLTARCLARAHTVVDQLEPDKAVARAFDGARTVHAMTSPRGPAVQITNQATATANAAAATLVLPVPATEQERAEQFNALTVELFRRAGITQADAENAARHVGAEDVLDLPEFPTGLETP
ncbi:hypothetical protein ACFYPC_09650 [Streptomyces sp. NPDC005808]|uniref:hypothetical protein n=1 Tax=Streptomyces sp. NPDC005808 TaxID=3364734 RepID=UPI0036C51463